jgi:folate-binding Fe-S cluster repair protein YgfZ
VAEVLVAEGINAGLVWHLGDPLGEQRLLEQGQGIVVWSNRDIVAWRGPDRLRHLAALTTRDLADLAEGQSATACRLDSEGHISFDVHLVVGADAVWGWTEPGLGAELEAWTERMKLRFDVTTTHHPELALVWEAGGAAGDWDKDGLVMRRGEDSLGGAEWFVPRAGLAERLAGQTRAGVWAYEARRIAAGMPRIGRDSDQRSTPDELGDRCQIMSRRPFRDPAGGTAFDTTFSELPPTAVSADQSCCPGRAAVSRTPHPVRPPRRLVRLHLDGSAEAFLPPGTPLEHDGTVVGRLGTMAYHWQLGPIGLALVRRDLPDGATVSAAGVAAAVETLGDS